MQVTTICPDAKNPFGQAKAQREAQGKVKTQRDSLLNDSGRVDSEADTTAQSTEELHERQRHIDSMSPTKIQASELPGSAGPRRSSTAARTTAAIEHFPVRVARVDSDSDSDMLKYGKETTQSISNAYEPINRSLRAQISNINVVDDLSSGTDDDDDEDISRPGIS